MDRKFKLTTDEMVLDDGTVLYRVQALKSFNGVRKGQIGGFVESEDNLAQFGNSWVRDDAKVYGKAFITEDAEVAEGAEVFGEAYIAGGAEVFGEAKVYGNAEVHGNALVYGNAEVSGRVLITDGGRVSGHVKVSGQYRVVIRNTLKGSQTVSINPIVLSEGLVTIVITDNHIQVEDTVLTLEELTQAALDKASYGEVTTPVENIRDIVNKHHR